MDDKHVQRRAVKVRMLFFGPLAEKIGSREIEVPLDEGTTLMELAEKFHLSKLIGSGLRIAIDGEITEKMDQPLSDSTEVAFLPPVSGG
ncbi:MAG: MoaD/ThiS family protein [Candidatus Thermoplasmatota archaeon]|nr:MoaD/ThiS family protein [Candidatus Thermoplasmatota archaeon]